MANDETEHQTDLLSPKDMQKWLSQEMKDSVKAHEMRMADAIAFTTAYALGELTPEQAHERSIQYSTRWGEALPGTHAFQGATDDQILDAIDKATAYSTEDAFAKHFEKERISLHLDRARYHYASGSFKRSIRS